MAALEVERGRLVDSASVWGTYTLSRANLAPRVSNFFPVVCSLHEIVLDLYAIKNCAELTPYERSMECGGNEPT